jgi:hypothetical protein
VTWGITRPEKVLIERQQASFFWAKIFVFMWKVVRRTIFFVRHFLGRLRTYAPSMLVTSTRCLRCIRIKTSLWHLRDLGQCCRSEVSNGNQSEFTCHLWLICAHMPSRVFGNIVRLFRTVHCELFGMCVRFSDEPLLLPETCVTNRLHVWYLVRFSQTAYHHSAGYALFLI